VKKVGKWEWQVVHRTEPPGPIMSLTLMQGNGDGRGGEGDGGDGGEGAHRLVYGDAHGCAVIVAVPTIVPSAGVCVEVSWQASEPRRLLDVFCCGGGGSGGGSGSLFTSEVGGEVKWWTQGSSDGSGGGSGDKMSWSLAGVAAMPFGRRVLAVVRTTQHPGCFNPSSKHAGNRALDSIP